MAHEALLIVDLQNDFLPGGALAVPDGDLVVPVVDRLVDRFELVVATQDWHPPNHEGFVTEHPGHGVGDVVELHGLRHTLWPVHCVQGTRGADFADGWARERVSRVFRKGTDPEVDSYSGFFDNARRHDTGLGGYLRDRRVSEVFVVGLATDYCVRFSAADALDLGFGATVFEDACRGVDLHPGDSARALEELQVAGATVRQTEEFLRSRE